MDEFLTNLFGIIFDVAGDIFTAFFDVVINILSILPASPFAHALEAVTGFEYLGYMNYFIPFHALADVMNLWLTAVLAYYIYRYVKKYTDKFQDYAFRFRSLFTGG